MINKRFRYGASVSPEPMPRKTPFFLTGDLRRASEILLARGYDAVELQIRNPLEFSASQSWFPGFCEENGFLVSAVGTGSEFVLNRLSFTSPDAQVRKATVARLKEHIDLASKYNTGVIIGTVRGNLAEGMSEAQYHAYAKEALSELCEYALPKNVNLLLEAINLYVMDFYNSVAQASDMADAVGAPNIKVHIDTHHMAVEEKDMLKSIENCGKRVGYVHFSENNRLYPGGCGGVDFTAVMKKLVEIGYGGFIALECIPEPDGETGLRLGMEHLMLCESRL